MLVGEIVRCNAQKYPNKVGLVDESGNRLTWQGLNVRVSKLAHALLGMGMKKGDRAAIISENCNQYVEFLFAVSKIGVIGVGLNYRLTGSQLSLIIDDCEPKVVFVQNKFSSLINSIQSELKSVESYVGLGDGHGYRYDYESLIAPYPNHEPEIDIREDDIHMLCYTSGATGSPKGVMVTHKQRIMACVVICLSSRYTQDDIVLIGQPLCVVGGQSWLFGVSFIGATVAIHVFSGKGFVEMIEREKVTSFSTSLARYLPVRDYLSTCNRGYDLSSLRSIRISGGQPCPHEKLIELLDFFKVYDVNKIYGMTETAGGVTYLLPEEAALYLSPKATEKEKRRLSSVGKTILNSELRIVDENDQDLGPGEVGEILLRGDLITKGYWNKLELNQQTFRNGWYHTSDLGFLDEEGYLFFVERKDSMIKSGGFFVAPQEVENVILQHPAVSEVVVIGVPDDRWGQMVKAAIVLRSGYSLSEEEVKAHCRKYLAGYQVPKSIRFVAQLPKEPTYGKILMPQLKELLES